MNNTLLIILTLLVAQFGDFIVPGSTCTVQVKKSRLKMLRSDGPTSDAFSTWLAWKIALLWKESCGLPQIAAGFQAGIEIEQLQ